jgi:hypothetical protein
MIVLVCVMLLGIPTLLHRGLVRVQERIVHQAALPDIRKFRDEATGRYFDVGARYEAVTLSGTGFYVRNMQWCAYYDESDCPAVSGREFFVERAKPKISRIPDNINPRFFDAYGIWTMFAIIFVMAALKGHITWPSRSRGQAPRSQPTEADPWA